MPDHVLEVVRGRLERGLEALTDAAVGLLDQPLELGHGGLEGAALCLELLHVRARLVVPLLGERVDRTELLAPAGEALDAGLQVGSMLVLQRLVERLDILEAEAPCDAL